MRVRVHRVVPAGRSARQVFDYLADFENAEEWDSGTVSCTRVSGAGGPGTIYRNISRFAGRTVCLVYQVERSEFPEFVIVGRNAGTTSRDVIRVLPEGAGALVDYSAEFTFTGLTAVITPLLRPLLKRLADRTAAQLELVLGAP